MVFNFFATYYLTVNLSQRPLIVLKCRELKVFFYDPFSLSLYIDRHGGNFIKYEKNNGYM